MVLNKLTPVFCMMAYTAVVTHLILLFYKISGSQEIKDMTKSFTKHQQQIYKEIQSERRIHYIYGLLVGIALAMAYISWFPNAKHPICSYIGIATMVAQNFYLLMPKSKWMVEYLDNPQDIFNWNKVYKKFQYLSAYGNFIGFVFFVAGRL
jgi:hypothetical protein